LAQAPAPTQHLQQSCTEELAVDRVFVTTRPTIYYDTCINKDQQL